MDTKLRYYSLINYFKFSFSLIIAIWHFPHRLFLTHGYIVVDFFFIVSGVFLYNSYKNNPKSPIDYIMSRIKKFYFPYIVSLFPLLFQKEVYNPIRLLPEFMLFQNIGFYGGGLNTPLWYLSVLIIGSFFVYSLIFNFERVSITLFFPLTILMTFTGIFSLSDSIENWSTIGVFYLPLWRGIADIMLGTILLKIVMDINFSSLCQNVLDVVCLISLFILFYFFFCSKCYDRFCILLFVLIILSFISPNSFYNKHIKSVSFSRFLGNYSVYIYFSHLTAIRIHKIILSFFNFSYIIDLLSYLIIVLLIAYLLKQIDVFYKKRINIKQKK